MTAQLRRISGPGTREIPLLSPETILGPKKPSDSIEALDSSDPLGNRYTKICLFTPPIYRIKTIASAIYVLRDSQREQLVQGKDPYRLIPGDKIEIGHAIYTYEASATGRMLKGNNPLPILLNPIESTLGIAPHPNTALAKKHYTVSDLGVDDYHVVLSPDGTEPLYAVSDMGNNPDGTFINYQLLPNNQENLHWLEVDDKLLIGKTSRDKGTVFTFEEAPIPTSSKPSSPRNNFLGGLILGLILGAILVGIVSQNSSTPDKTLMTLCSALKGGDYQGAYKQLSNAAQKQTTEQHFASTLMQTFAQQGGLKGCTTGNIETVSTPNRGTLDLNFKAGKTVSYSVSLVQEDSTWKVDAWEPKLVILYGRPIARLST